MTMKPEQWDDLEGIQFARQMDTVIAEIVEAVQSDPKLKERDGRLMATCFISMSAQCVLNMSIDKKNWLELCELIYDAHHAKENVTSH